MAALTGLGTRSGRLVGALALLGLLVLSGCTDSAEVGFDDLAAGQRVYDATGGSLTGTEAEDLSARLDRLRAETGADVVVYVRELDADPEETLDQVEDLQQTWVQVTGTDQDTAVGLLVNREPGSDDEARAGLFVGSTFDDGNVPSGEQEEIIENAVVPPLRDGDVAASLTAGIDRLDRAIRTGPEPGALDDVAEGAGSTWLPWAGLAGVLLGGAAVLLVERRRSRPSTPAMSPGTHRPDATTPAALGAVLASGTTHVKAVPALVLQLAARDALVLEVDPDGSGPPAARVRLLATSEPADELERALWNQLQDEAEAGVVSSADLAKVVADTAPTRAVLRAQLAERGWWQDGVGRSLAVLALVGSLALAATALGIAIAATGAPLMLVAAVPAGLLVLACVGSAVVHTQLTSAGLDAARPWRAYHDGLKAAAKDEAVPLDLDAVLPDLVAMGLAGRYAERLEAAQEQGSGLRAFTAPDGLGSASAVVPWTVFSTTFVSGGGSSGTVSSGGAGGGGGAAGGT